MISTYHFFATHHLLSSPSQSIPQMFDDRENRETALHTLLAMETSVPPLEEDPWVREETDELGLGGHMILRFFVNGLENRMASCCCSWLAVIVS